MSRRITPIPSVNSTTSDIAVRQARKEKEAWADPSVKVPKESKSHDQQDKTAKPKPKKIQPLKSTSSSASKSRSAPIPDITVTPSASTKPTKAKLTTTTSTTSTTSLLKPNQKSQIQDGSSGRGHHSHSQHRAGSSSIISNRAAPIAELADNQIQRKPKPQESLVVPTKKSTISSTKGVETAYLAPQGLPAILPTGKHPKAETPKKQIAFATDSEVSLHSSVAPSASMVSATSRASEKSDGEFKVAPGSTVNLGEEIVVPQLVRGDDDDESEQEYDPIEELLEDKPKEIRVTEDSTRGLSDKDKDRLKRIKRLYKNLPIDGAKVVIHLDLSHFMKQCFKKGCGCRYHIETTFIPRDERLFKKFTMGFHNNLTFKYFLGAHNTSVLIKLNENDLLSQKGTAGINKYLAIRGRTVNDQKQITRKKNYSAGPENVVQVVGAAPSGASVARSVAPGSGIQRVTAAPSGYSVARSVAPGSVVASGSRASGFKAPGSGTLL